MARRVGEREEKRREEQGREEKRGREGREGKLESDVLALEPGFGVKMSIPPKTSLKPKPMRLWLAFSFTKDKHQCIFIQSNIPYRRHKVLKQQQQQLRNKGTMKNLFEILTLLQTVYVCARGFFFFFLTENILRIYQCVRTTLILSLFISRDKKILLHS